MRTPIDTAKVRWIYNTQRNGSPHERDIGQLCDEIDRLASEVKDLNECLSEMTTKAWDQSHRAEAAEAAQVPDGHARIDGDLYRVEVEDLGDPFGNKAYLFEVEPGDTDAQDSATDTEYLIDLPADLHVVIKARAQDSGLSIAETVHSIIGAHLRTEALRENFLGTSRGLS